VSNGAVASWSAAVLCRFHIAYLCRQSPVPCDTTDEQVREAFDAANDPRVRRCARQMRFGELGDAIRNVLVWFVIESGPNNRSECQQLPRAVLPGVPIPVRACRPTRFVGRVSVRASPNSSNLSDNQGLRGRSPSGAKPSLNRSTAPKAHLRGLEHFHALPRDRVRPGPVVMLPDHLCLQDRIV
jgi:hypothetical protein